jgi:protein SCO1/2
MRLFPVIALSLIVASSFAGYKTLHDANAASPVVETRDGGSRPDPDAKPVSVGGPFTLVDHTGKTVTEKDFLGKYLIVFFGFTYCPDICPTELQTALDAVGLLSPAQAAKVQPVFISIDPKRDTPPVLKEYLQQFGDNIVGLTGSDEQVAAVARAYKVYYGRAEDHEHSSEGEDSAYMMDHSSFLYLMGPDGAFIKVFPSGTEVDALAGSLNTIVKP